MCYSTRWRGMMAKQDDLKTQPRSEVLLELLRLDVGSAVALVGHPIHVMMVHFPIAFVIATLGVDVFYWWSGDAFWVRVGLWSAGMAFWSGGPATIAGANWGLRLIDTAAILPHGLALSALASVMVGFAGWHGGKLVFDHGVGILIS